ncbi:HET domain-containing protein [Aspergillus ibericus CBS 121593]|uniref:HET-domain-containing protein n=1 Tax=Aspergillus ibericus CBS 121593 TaxID=1448316 RepID=A0A395HE97_9EURO|nr:HET-domain-containing protein [Aspergillus ibericus CBS 121593]RAL06060.1 HET-domain-containing protein [Aspergillus ibericus CBS 121593]
MPEKLKVIDVHHDRVVDAPPDCQYLTLSYVFGHVTRLEIPSSGCFDRHQLPATIRDALIACQNVGFQFLWVDQICIDQKNEVELQTQINQMSHIYRAATCTLVALAGEDSLYGLPGVSRGRTWKQNTVKLDERLVVQLTPPMDVCLENSKWATRGWTFQEDLFSSRLIFFSEVGLFYNDRLVESSSNVLSEDGCHSTCWAHLPSLLLYWDVLAFYTRRKLSYPSDAVRAFTAILHEVHGRNGTYYGLPLQYFDQGVLWIPQNPTLPSTERHTQFPSWSWASHDGDITHINAGTPLAVWAKPEVTGSTVNMRICRPVSGAEWEPRWGDCRGRLANIYAAWTAGCIPSLLPETFSRLLSTQSPFSTRLWGDMPFITTLEGPSLKDLWPTYHAFWEEALGAQIHDDLFPTDHLKHLPSLDGLIATHSQVAYFDVRPPTEKLIMKDGSRTFRVQSPTGALSGAIRIPEYLQSPSVPCRGEFLLLSITEEAYTDVVNLLSVEDDHRIEHVVHDRTLRQCDRYGEKGHDRETMVNVMLISRSGNHDIARRVGVGQIFLKSWAEAERQFKSIFLQ